MTDRVKYRLQPPWIEWWGDRVTTFFHLQDFSMITEMKAVNDKLSFTKEFSSFVSVAYFFTHGILGQVAGIVVNYELLV